MKINRRDFLKLAGIGSAVFASGLGGLDPLANRALAAEDDFFFVQLSDTHWGFTGPAVNPDSAGTLKKAVEAVNNLKIQPDFIMFTGDLTHVTDDDKDRRRRLSEFQDITSKLKAKNMRFMPGEHDAGLDEGRPLRSFLERRITPLTTRGFTSSSSTTFRIRHQRLEKTNWSG